MTNHLEQLVGEWLELNGYFVRRNVLVGPRAQGGYDGELDAVAFHPGTRHLLHVEPSLDAHSWELREERFARKFALGRTHIPQLLAGLDAPPEVDQVALLVFASRSNVEAIGGGRIMLIGDLMQEIMTGVCTRRVERSAVPEQFGLVRTIQFCCQYALQSDPAAEPITGHTLVPQGTASALSIDE